MGNTPVSLPVDHVSDTAYWVAIFRAHESERDDAKFKDPFARLLAGPKQQQLEEAMPFHQEGHWLLTVRTCLLDEHILRLVAEGVDTVVNLASGLDTRPYRLDLPTGLHWIEADLPDITAYKTQKLSSESPNCLLERVAIDLSDEKARQVFFSSLPSSRTLVITEGLLPYLSPKNVEELSNELLALPSVTDWLMDVMTTQFLARLRDKWKTDPATSVTLNFAPDEGTAFFEKLGWKLAHFDSFLDASERIGRQPAIPLESWDSGIALLKK